MPLNFTSFPELTTERLLLRRLTKDDAPQIFALRSSDVVNKYLDRPKAKSIEDAHDFIKRIDFGVDGRESMYWAICLLGQSELAGTISLWNFSDEGTKAEIGYELLPQFHGKGIMQEALLKVIDYGFRNLQLQLIEAWTVIQNLKSIKILERNDFKRDFSAESGIDRGVEGDDRIIYSLKKPAGI
jgi:ribosomal-protein-alanine N-acetyltransferase